MEHKTGPYKGRVTLWHSYLSGTKLYCLVTEVHVPRRFAKGQRVGDTRTRDLSITSPIML